MEFQKLSVDVRRTFGKGAARRLRASGRVPAVLYGREVRPAAPIALAPGDLRKALATPFGLNTVLELVVSDGDRTSAVLAMVQDRHVDPISGDLLHADFISVDPSRPVDVRVPLIAEGRAAGVQEGGRLLIIHREIPVRCLPDAIPPGIRVDVTPLAIGATLKAGQLPVPADVRVTLDAMQTIIAVVAPEAEPKPEVELEAAAAAAAAAAAGEATPAEGVPKPAEAKPGEAKPAAAEAKAAPEARPKGKEKRGSEQARK